MVAVDAPRRSGTALIGAVCTKGRLVVFRVVLGTPVNATSQTVIMSSRKLVEST